MNTLWDERNINIYYIKTSQTNSNTHLISWFKLRHNSSSPLQTRILSRTFKWLDVDISNYFKYVLIAKN